MIKCKEGLINTYIENDFGELRDLYLAKCEEFGICADDIDKNSGTIGVLDRCDISMWHNLMERTIDKCRKLTLSDLKSRTRTEYEKVTESIFDLRDEFERGELYFTANGDIDNMRVIETELHLVQLLKSHMEFTNRGYVYRSTEKQVDWREEVHAWQHTKKVGIYTPLDFVVSDLIESHPDKFLELCRVALRANGEIE